MPLRYTTFCLSLVGSAGLLVAALVWGGLWWWLGFGVCAALALLGVRDMTQVRHSVLRNYPIIGHLRFLLEFIRPEMRQYFIESDHEALPFSRAQRSWFISAPRATRTAARWARSSMSRPRAMNG